MSYEPRITSQESRVKTARTAPATPSLNSKSEHIPSRHWLLNLLLMHAMGETAHGSTRISEQELGRGDSRTILLPDYAARERRPGRSTSRAIRNSGAWTSVTPEVLIPRPETEHVIEVVLERLAIAAGNAASHRDAGRIASPM